VALAPRQAGSVKMAFASGRLRSAKPTMCDAPKRREILRDHLQRVWGQHRLRDDLPKEWLVLLWTVRARAGRPARDSPATRKAASTAAPLATDAAEQSIAASSAPMAQSAASERLVCVDHRLTFPPRPSPHRPRRRRFPFLAGNRRRFLPATAATAVASVVLPGAGRACRIFCFASNKYRLVADNSYWCFPRNQQPSCHTHAPAGTYERHCPETTLLYRTITRTLVDVPGRSGSGRRRTACLRA